MLAQPRRYSHSQLGIRVANQDNRETPFSLGGPLSSGNETKERNDDHGGTRGVTWLRLYIPLKVHPLAMKPPFRAHFRACDFLQQF